MKTEKTITGDVDPDVLDYTVGDDPVLDMDLVRWDCLGTAAHVTMLSEMPKGCPFAPRCDNAMKICLRERCERMRINEDHMAACWMNVKEQSAAAPAGDATEGGDRA